MKLIEKKNIDKVNSVAQFTILCKCICQAPPSCYCKEREKEDLSATLKTQTANYASTAIKNSTSMHF